MGNSGAYRYRRYKSNNNNEPPPSLALPAGADRSVVERIVEGVWLGRDLINTPASDLGPAELEAAARNLAEQHGANIDVIAGSELAAGFPLIHAVGRASDRPPRLIDLVGALLTRPKVTLVGKGICFDTGGLDVKPANAMLLMKKDMGGAAAALALAHMIMGLRLYRCACACSSRRPRTASAATPSVLVMCCAVAQARRSRLATPMPKAAWFWPMPLRSPTRRNPTAHLVRYPDGRCARGARS